MDATTAETIRNKKRTEEAGVAVLPENWNVVQLLGHLSGGCWRYAPMGGIIGLDYPQIESVLRLRGIKKKKRKKLFEQLQWVERGALDTFSANKNR